MVKLLSGRVTPTFPPFFYRVAVAAAYGVMVASVMLLNGCAAVLSSYTASATTRMAENLSRSFLNCDDPATVETGAPAYLLMMDSLLLESPNNESLLLSAAKLYTSYTSAFVKDEERAKRLSQKGFDYALRAACHRSADLCKVREMPFDAYTSTLAQLKETDLPILYALGAAWTSYLEAHRNDWRVVAQVPRVEAIMNRVIELNELYEDGGAHLYLGVFATLMPPALGGRPEIGKAHFERALAISGKKNLMAYVLYARHYARMRFDRELHDRLLNEALSLNPRMDGYILINMAAQAEARNLLATADDYF